jgi:putative glycosyltransferase
MRLSVVTTLYLSSPYINEFHRRISAEISKLSVDYEIIMVNDGSPGDSLAVACALCKTDPHLKVVSLSRNFGHHRAMMTGLEYAVGDRVFLIDVDLEESPEILVPFWSAMDADSTVDVVIGEQVRKTVPYFKRTTSDFFYGLFNRLASVKLSSRDIVSRLMTRNYVNAVLAYTERELFFPAIWEDVGFKQIRLPAFKTFDGNSTYTMRKKLRMAVDAITSFSSKPLVCIFYLGLAFSLFAVVYIGYLVVQKFVVGNVVAGWTSVMAAIFLVGGIITFALGVIGVYLAKVYDQVKARPNRLVIDVYTISHLPGDLPQPSHGTKT